MFNVDSHIKSVPLLTVTAIAISTTNVQDDAPPHFVANHNIYTSQILGTIMRTSSDGDDVFPALPSSDDENTDNDKSSIWPKP